jgi:hypothetical protein
MVILECTDEEDTVERFKLEVTFCYVKDAIESKKTNITENSHKYLDWAREYLTNAQKTLDSIVNFKESNGYFKTPYFMEISKILNDNVKPTSKDADNLKCKLELMLGSLDKLEKTPEKFYETQDCKSVLNYCNNLANFFSPKIYALYED